MKRNYLIVAAVCLAFGITACTPKTSETTAAETTAAAETSEETKADAGADADTESKKADGETEEKTTEAEKPAEKKMVTGRVTGMEDTIVTISGQDDMEYQVDLKDAETKSTLEIGEGDEIQVVFLDDDAEVKQAESYDVISSVALEGDADPTIAGVIQDATMNTVTIQAASGKTYQFSTMIAQTVTGDKGIAVGENVEITYLGELAEGDGGNTALRVITEEGSGDADATYKALTGSFVSGADGSVTIQAEDGSEFTFALGENVDVSDFEAGEAVEVIYEGSLTSQNAVAEGVDYQ
ncbi:MAG: hypothetical protein Q4F29_08060 [Lachnospiraceae bacterium]|nr:hypothetical protein [Lachnospiraceae bacterium]